MQTTLMNSDRSLRAVSTALAYDIFEHIAEEIQLLRQFANKEGKIVSGAIATVYALSKGYVSQAIFCRDCDGNVVEIDDPETGST